MCTNFLFLSLLPLFIVVTEFSVNISWSCNLAGSLSSKKKKLLYICPQVYICPRVFRVAMLIQCSLAEGTTAFVTKSNRTRFKSQFYIKVYDLLQLHVSLASPACTCSHWDTRDLELTSVQFSHSVMSNSLWPHELQHARPPCPSPTPRVHPNPCPLSRGCHPTISSSVVLFSSCPQSCPPSGSFQMSQFFTSGSQSIGVSPSASVLPVNTQG